LAEIKLVNSLRLIVDSSSWNVVILSFIAVTISAGITSFLLTITINAFWGYCFFGGVSPKVKTKFFGDTEKVFVMESNEYR